MAGWDKLAVSSFQLLRRFASVLYFWVKNLENSRWKAGLASPTRFSVTALVVASVSSIKGSPRRLYLDKISAEFAIARQGIKPILEWWSDADKDSEPFDISDIVKFAPAKKFVKFEDQYEEVPDEPKVITAREQWEKASTCAVLVQESEDYAYNDAIIFYTIKDGVYLKEIYPPLSELRKDAEFVTNYISFVRNTHDGDLEAALEWLAGREYTMSEITLLDIYDIANDKDVIEYEDKTFQEVSKQEFSEEIDALRKKMVAHIIEQCEQGMLVNEEVLCRNYTLNWTDKSHVFCEELEDCWIAKDNDGKWKFYRKDRDGEWDSEIEYFTIETLKDIIEVLQ